MSDPTREILQTVFEVGTAVAGTIMAAIQAGDVSTVEALAKVCPRPEVLKARDAALKQQQYLKAVAELGGSER